MPIKPENKARYPKDWPAIRARILDRAEHKCERCGVRNYELGGRDHDGVWLQAWPKGERLLSMEWPKPGERWTCGDRHPPQILRIIRIVLTIAHLGRPAHAPVHLHVTRSAKTDEVVRMVGFSMPRGAKHQEWQDMMHRRALAEFFGRSPAVAAGFLVSIPCLYPSRGPRWPVVGEAAPVSPEVIVLSDWGLLGKPWQSARIAAESSAGAEVPATDVERLSAALACSFPEATLADANAFYATGFRASDSVVGSLLRRELEFSAAGSAIAHTNAFSWSRHNAILYHLDEYPENCSDDNLRAWCQRCHLAYDQKHHQLNAFMTRRKRIPITDMFAA